MPRNRFAIEMSVEGEARIIQAYKDIATASEDAANRAIVAEDRAATAAVYAEKTKTSAREREAQKQADLQAKLDADIANLFGKGSASAPMPAAPAAPTDSQRKSAGDIVRLNMAQMRAQAIADQLTPWKKAQDGLNKEIIETRRLMEQGLITAAQYEARMGQVVGQHVASNGHGPSTALYQNEMDQRIATAQRMADAVNPAAKAQREFDAELARATTLLRSGNLAQADYDKYVAKLKVDLKGSSEALVEHAGFLGLNRAQFITAQSAAMRFSDSIIAGQTPIRAFALEAHKLVEVVSMDEGGMAGGLAKVTALVNPMTIGLAAITAATVIAAKAAYGYAASLNAMDRAAGGFGRTSQVTGEQLLMLAQRHSTTAEVSVAAARDTETAILQETRTSGDALGRAIDISQRYADAMGVDAKKANEDLAKAMADPAKAADELGARYGMLTDMQVEQIHTLMDQNRLTDAQSALLADLDGALDKTGEHVDALTRLWRNLSTAMSDGWNDIGDGIRRALGSYTDTEKMANLQAKIATEQRALAGYSAHPSIMNKFMMPDLESQLQADQAQYTAMAQAAQKKSDDADRNRIVVTATNQMRSDNVSRVYSEQLDGLRTKLAELKQEAALGDHSVALDTDIARYQHAARTWMPENEKATALADAASERRRYARGTPQWQAAQRNYVDAKTSGQMLTDAEAAKQADDRADGFRPAKGRKDTAGSDAAASDAAAAAALRLADAYLKSGDAALRAEAGRKVATEASKKGRDADAEAARQLQLMVADQIASSAKSVRSLEDDTAARNRVLASIKAGITPAADMQNALAREAALRPLVTAQTVAQGVVAAKLTEVIKAQTAAMMDNEAALRATAAQQAINSANDNDRANRLRGTLAGMRDPVSRARATAGDYASAQGWNSGDSAAYVNAQGTAAGSKQDADNAEWLANEQRRHDVAIALLTAQASGDDESIRRQTLLNQLDQAGIELNADQVTQILAAQQQEKSWSDQIQQHQQAIQQLKDVGAQSLNELLSPDGIQHFGQTFHSVLMKIATDFEQLALLNPLENMMFGGNRATLGGGGGIGGLFSSLFGLGGSTMSSTADLSSLSTMSFNFTPTLPAFAAGTDSAPGGLSLVGEEGPELVNLPRGAGVMTAKSTRAALASAANSNSVHMPITINAQGAGPREIDLMRVQMQEFQRQVPSIAVAAVSNANSRRIGQG